MQQDQQTRYSSHLETRQRLYPFPADTGHYQPLTALPTDHYTKAYRAKLDSLARLAGDKPALGTSESSVASKTT